MHVELSYQDDGRTLKVFLTQLRATGAGAVARDPHRLLREKIEALKPWLVHFDDCGATKPPYTYCSCGLNFAFESVFAELARLRGAAAVRPDDDYKVWTDDDKARMNADLLKPATVRVKE